MHFTSVVKYPQYCYHIVEFLKSMIATPFPTATAIIVVVSLCVLHHLVIADRS